MKKTGGINFENYTSLIPFNNNNNWIRYNDSCCDGNNPGLWSKNAIILLCKKDKNELFILIKYVD